MRRPVDQPVTIAESPAEQRGGRLKTTIRRATRSVAGWGATRNLVRKAVRDHGLRCILYHEIADAPSEFTAGLSVTTSPDTLRSHLGLLARDYEFVSLENVLDGAAMTGEGKPPLLVTFDDAYAGVAGIAADVCQQADVPSVFFVNGAFVDNATLAFDNLVAWTVNTNGMGRLAAEAGRDFSDLAEFFGPFLSSIALTERRRIYDDLAVEMPETPDRMAAGESLYVTSEALAALHGKGMVVGNHTWSHAYCRHVDDDAMETEITANNAFLESVVGYPITSFSYPYGSHLDASQSVTAELTRLGHRAAFLVESRANAKGRDPMQYYRVSVGSVETADLFTDLEVLPVIRRVRDRIKA
jgi:peptidoglycan/xylan/chitin deacetylase (PgdA/CDA1 family)